MKIIIKGIILIIIGFFLGHILFGTKIDFVNKISNKDNFIFLQQGVYSNIDNLNNNSKELDNKIIDKHNNKYYVYVGITKDEKIADKIIKMYEKKGINLIKKERYLKSQEFSSNVEQFDILMNSTKEDDEALTIQEVVLANYKEIIKKE